jgi:predicted phage terminase large subunit-like protein
MQSSLVGDIAKNFRSPLALATEFSKGEWQPARHLRVIDFEFQNLLEDPTLDCLIVKCPVRHGKSEYLARWAPTWYKLRYPAKRIMLCSNTSKLARSHSRWVRDKVHELSPAFGLKGVDPNNASATEWNLDGAGMGGCIAAGVDGSIVGFGADLLIIDDYLKSAKAAYSETVRDAQWDWFVTTSGTRLEPGGKIVLLCSAWHEDDLIGRILSRRDQLDMRVRCITLQALRDSSEGKDPLGRQDGEALWPERWPAEALERKKKIAGIWWHSIYQGRPKGVGLSSWPASYFMNLWVDEDDWPTDMVISASALDPSKGKNAKAGDYQAMVYVGYRGGKLYIDCDMDRRPIPAMVRRYVAFNQERRPALAGIESNAFQELLGDDYSDACWAAGYNADPPALVNNTVNKNLRIERLGKFFAAGMIRFRRTAGCEILLQQLKDFPNGKHDDGPDAMEQAIRLLCEAFDELRGLNEILETAI